MRTVGLREGKGTASDHTARKQGGVGMRNQAAVVELQQPHPDFEPWNPLPCASVSSSVKRSVHLLQQQVFMGFLLKSRYWDGV